MNVARDAADLDIGEHARPWQQSRLLEHHPRILRARFRAKTDASGIDALQASNQTQERALAAAALADDRDELARGNMDVDAAQHLVVTKRFAQAADGERQTAATYFRALPQAPRLLDIVGPIDQLGLGNAKT